MPTLMFSHPPLPPFLLVHTLPGVIQNSIYTEGEGMPSPTGSPKFLGSPKSGRTPGRSPGAGAEAETFA